MSRMKGVLRQLRAVLRKDAVERELDNELAFHVEMATRRNIERGAAPEEARRQALLRFHGVERHKEAVRDNRWTRVIDDVLMDLRFAVRSLARQPLLALVAMLAIGVGVGAMASVFSVTRALLLAPLPVASPERLYTVLEQRGGMVRQNNGEVALPWGRYRAYEEAASEVFSGLAAYAYTTVALRQAGESQATNGLITSANYFDILGLRPAVGRFYGDGETGVAVVSHGLWQRRFGGSADVIGASIYVDSRPYTVVGVAPREFGGLMRWIPTDIYLPFPSGAVDRPKEDTWVVPFGRLAPGIPRIAAAEVVNAAALRIPPDEPQTTVRGARLEPLTGMPAFARTGTAWFMTLLFAMAGLVLFIACANIAGVLLARGVARRQELAVRLAIGAARGRLMRQLLTETLVLFVLGGALGILLANVTTAALASVQLPFAEQVSLDVSPDGVVLIFAFAVAILTGIFFGLLPALRASRPDVVTALKAVGGSRESLRARHIFVSAQLALAVILLITGGLFVRSVQSALRFDPGFSGRGALLLAADAGPHGYDDTRATLLQQEWLDGVRALPDVEGAALAQLPVLGGMTHRNDAYGLHDDAAEPARINVTLNRVDEHFAEALGVRLVAGRWIETSDNASATPVVVLNETAAAALWPGESAVGKRLGLWGEREVVGVVAAGRYDGLASAPGPHVYLSLHQHPAQRVTMHIAPRSGGDRSRVLQDARAVLAALDPNIAPEGARPLADVMNFSMLPQRFAAAVIGVFGAAGLLLAAFGLYAVLAFHVAQRTREFGIRAALGADRAAVTRLVLGRGLRLAAIGCGVGVLVAAALGRVLSALLVGVSPLDPVTFFAVPLILMTTTLLAAAVPARRAVRADPMRALRTDG
jgi:putative ABC transport system permease protein